jgi:hypothetical protein
MPQGMTYKNNPSDMRANEHAATPMRSDPSHVSSIAEAQHSRKVCIKQNRLTSDLQGLHGSPVVPEPQTNDDRYVGQSSRLSTQPRNVLLPLGKNDTCQTLPTDGKREDVSSPETDRPTFEQQAASTEPTTGVSTQTDIHPPESVPMPPSPAIIADVKGP